MRKGLRAILETDPDLEVVGEAQDGFEAVERTAELKPDLVLLDLSMPRTNGFDALKEIKRVSAGSRVLVLTMYKTEAYVFAALRAGADGYALKDSSVTELFSAVQSVLAGERYLSPAVATMVVAGFLSAKETSADHSVFGGLSTREREVLKLVAEGYRTREIGEFLNISPRTVEKHRGNLLAKLKLHNVAGLIAYAMEIGLVTGPGA